MCDCWCQSLHDSWIFDQSSDCRIHKISIQASQTMSPYYIVAIDSRLYIKKTWIFTPMRVESVDIMMRSDSWGHRKARAGARPGLGPCRTRLPSLPSSWIHCHFRRPSRRPWNSCRFCRKLKGLAWAHQKVYDFKFPVNFSAGLSEWEFWALQK